MNVDQIKVGQYLLGGVPGQRGWLCKVMSISVDVDGGCWVGVNVKGCACQLCQANGGSTEACVDYATLRVPGVVAAFRKKLWRFK